MKQHLAWVVFVAASSLALAGCSSAPLSPSADRSGSAGAPTTSPTTPAPALTSDYVDYPPGPYGTTRGAVIENLEFLGWKRPADAGYDAGRFEKVRLSDFYNPDQRSELKLLAVNASAVWCVVCRSEYQDMNTNGTYDTVRPQGIELLGTLFEDVSYFPAQPADLTRWGQASNHAVKFPLVLDPGFKMGAYFTSDATPLNMVIDVRTMTIVLVTMGYSPTYWDTVRGLLAKTQ